MRKSTPTVMVIQVIVSSRYLTRRKPVTNTIIALTAEILKYFSWLQKYKIIPISRVNYLTFYYFCSKNEDVMTILYLVRHGETVDNANHIMQGQTPGELNEKGVQQAKELAEQLRMSRLMLLYQATYSEVSILVN